ncbi:MAG: RNA polymerase sigma factor [Bacteroidota bacterium]
MTDRQQIFDSWLQTHRGLWFKVVRAYAFTPEDQDDLFQEISLQVWRSIPNFKAESAPQTWIYRVALNTALTWQKKSRRHAADRQDFLPERQILQAVEEEDERLNWLYAQIATLEEVDRSLALLLLDGYRYKEMAAILGISESNVGVKIHRIKQHLMRKAKTYDHPRV